MAGIFKLHSKFLSTLQTRNHEVNRQSVIVPDFPLSGKRNYVVEEFSAKHQRAIILPVLSIINGWSRTDKRRSE